VEILIVILLVVIWLLMAGICGLVEVIGRQKIQIERYSKALLEKSAKADRTAPLNAMVAPVAQFAQAVRDFGVMETVEEDVERRR
jgi:hypothetical protein